MTITHTFQSAKTDGADAAVVQPSDWNAAHTIAAGYTLLRQTTLTMTNAQIIANDTPYIIVPATQSLGYAGAPTTIPVPLSVTVVLNNAAGAYGNVDGDPVYRVVIGSDWSIDLMEVAASGLNSAGGARVSFPQYIQRKTAGASPADPHTHSSLTVMSGFDLTDGIEDNALAFVVANQSAGVFTGGHASNTLKVTVIYQVITL